jgi:hypothetical protein
MRAMAEFERERTSVVAFNGKLPRVDLREFEYCREKVWPSWAPGWVSCGSVLRDGRCEKYGHRQSEPLPTDR